MPRLLNAIGSPNGQVLFVPMEEETGSIVYDRSGNSNDGTIYGALRIAGLKGLALSFDGVDDYVKAPHANSLDLSAELSILAWFKTSATSGSRGLVSYDDETVNLNIAYMIYLPNSNAIRGFIANGTGLNTVTKTGTSDGLWHFIAFILTATELKLYVDNVAVVSATRTINPRVSTDNSLKIGRYRDAESWSGLIDEVRIYSRALSAEEIRRIYLQSQIKFWHRRQMAL